ncbi:MAG: DUF1846 domain-containing protein, partial [Thermodesulfovibrionales bacterium]|nr:DUF1846 domain-containing protein [Thermodesulfovibrionales bacterium]
EAYDIKAVNYNRDIEAFPLVKRILEKITENPLVYHSPTDMGVNRAGFSICDDQVVRAAATQEIIRRYFRTQCEYALGVVDKDTVERLRLFMEDLGVNEESRSVVRPARLAAQEAQTTGKGHAGIYCGAAIELADGTIITGKNSPLLHASSSLILNAAKHLAGIPDSMHLMPPSITESLGYLKKDILKSREVSLNLDETLIALGISASGNPAAQAAVEKLSELRTCEVHMTHMPTPGDEAGLRKLGVNLTSDPGYSTHTLFTG